MNTIPKSSRRARQAVAQITYSMPIPPYLEPKLVTVLREGIPRAQLLRDLVAGLTVGIVAFPLAIAFAIASGVDPAQGIATAIVAGLLISIFSGSRVQIGGPTGAFVVIVYGIVQEHGYAGLAVATMMAGALMILMGLVRFGSVIRFIPYPVTVGFTTGIAVIILTGQVRDFLGLEMADPPADFMAKLGAYGQHLSTARPWAMALAISTVVIVAIWPKITRRVPGSLIAIVATTIVVQMFDLPVDTIGSRFGEISNSLPRPRLPDFNLSLIRELVSPALSIALLGAIESLLSALVADGMTGRNHRPNAELVAQGIANLASPLFGGIPATGAIARTATNVKSGGRTPIAGIVHALTLLLLLVFLGPLASLVPMATLAGILVVIAYHMSEIHVFRRLFNSPRGDVLVLLSTFTLTVFVDLVVAIQAGVVLSALLFMNRMAEVTEVESARDFAPSDEGEDDPARLHRHDIPDEVEVFEVSGPFFFGAVDKFRNALLRIDRPQRAVVLRMRKVPVLDATALSVLDDLLVQLTQQGTLLILAGVNTQPRSVLDRSGFSKRIGEENICAGIQQALERTHSIQPRNDNA
jgi:SulP family sulfate permease